MSTVDKALAEEIIAADGYHEDDPRIQKVVKYTTFWNKEAYAILYGYDIINDTYKASDYVINPQVIWEAT